MCHSFLFVRQFIQPTSREVSLAKLEKGFNSLMVETNQTENSSIPCVLVHSLINMSPRAVLLVSPSEISFEKKIIILLSPSKDDLKFLAVKMFLYFQNIPKIEQYFCTEDYL